MNTTIETQYGNSEPFGFVGRLAEATSHSKRRVSDPPYS